MQLWSVGWRGQISPFSIGFHRHHYNTLALSLYVRVYDVTRALLQIASTRFNSSTRDALSLNNLACVISRQFDLITFVGLSRVTCVTQLHCLSNYFLNSAVKSEPIGLRIILLLKILKKFKVSKATSQRTLSLHKPSAQLSRETTENRSSGSTGGLK